MCTCVQQLAAPARLGAPPRTPLPGRIAQSLGLAAEPAPERGELTLANVEIINPGRVPAPAVPDFEGPIQ